MNADRLTSVAVVLICLATVVGICITASVTYDDPRIRVVSR